MSGAEPELKAAAMAAADATADMVQAFRDLGDNLDGLLRTLGVDVDSLPSHVRAHEPLRAIRDDRDWFSIECKCGAVIGPLASFSELVQPVREHCRPDNGRDHA